jgi:hypothetical protein
MAQGAYFEVWETSPALCFCNGCADRARLQHSSARGRLRLLGFGAATFACEEQLAWRAVAQVSVTSVCKITASEGWWAWVDSGCPVYYHLRCSATEGGHKMGHSRTAPPFRRLRNARKVRLVPEPTLLAIPVAEFVWQLLNRCPYQTVRG